MFCRLFEFRNDSGVDLGAFPEHCNAPECSYSDKTKCGVSKDIDIHLTKEKYGWRIDNKVNFPEPLQQKNGPWFYLKLIRIIHVTHDDIWLCKCLKKDKETVLYLMYQGGSLKDSHPTLESLNKTLNMKYSYDARPITDHDFE